MPIDSLFGDAGASLDWQYIISYAILLAPAVIPGVLFVYSFIKEPRQFRNALFLFATLAWSSILLVLRLNNFILGLILVTLVLLTPFLTIGFLLVNTVVVVRNNGFFTDIDASVFDGRIPCSADCVADHRELF